MPPNVIRPHPTNTGVYRPSPDYGKAAAPSEGERACYQDGPGAFPNLLPTGSFKMWKLDGLYPGVDLNPPNTFNCFAWSVDLTDRWFEGGNEEDMRLLYEAYHFVPCEAAEAEVDVYWIKGEPPMRQVGRRTVPKKRSFCKHAHRRDHGSLDVPPGLGCSSKMGGDPGLMAHNRLGLADERLGPEARAPPVTYGATTQHYVRASTHFSLPRNEGNVPVATGHWPNDVVFEQGYGLRPAGHPDNTVGLAGPSGTSTSPKTNSPKKDSPEKDVDSSKRPSSSYSSSSSSSSATRASTAHSSTSSSSSELDYAEVPKIDPYVRIPPPLKKSVEKAARLREAVVKALPRDAPTFRDFLKEWKKSWSDKGSYGPFVSSDYSSDFKGVDVFGDLVTLGKNHRALLALVVDESANKGSHFAVHLYNEIEDRKNYLIHPKDIRNHHVLQRQAALLVDINSRRDLSREVGVGAPQ